MNTIIYYLNAIVNIKNKNDFRNKININDNNNKNKIK
jgi:hypothetical protein